MKAKKKSKQLRRLAQRWLDEAKPLEFEDGSTDHAAIERRGERTGERAGLKRAASDLNAYLNLNEDIDRLISGGR